MDEGNKEPTVVEQAPPTGFSTIRKIEDLSEEALQSKPLVNVIGVLKDFQAPMKTNGTGHKCTFEILDRSVEGHVHGLKINMFGSPDKMPSQMNRADLLLIRNAKAQRFNGNLSLLTSFQTQIYVIRSESVPRTTKEISNAPWSCITSQRKPTPNPSETKFAMWLNSRNEEMDLPSDTEFKVKIEASKNVSNKFRLCKELQDTGNVKDYAEIIGQVVRIHDYGGDQVQMYITDYTKNDKFYNYQLNEVETEDFDDYGYKNAQPQSSKSNRWSGPPGKFSIQITVWDPHASFVRKQVKIGDWVLARNVKIKIGNQGYLEGVIHGENEKDIKVTVLKTSPSSPSPNQTRVQEAIRRKLEWTTKFEKQLKAYKDEGAGVGDKRKRNDEGKTEPREPSKIPKSKDRRKLERAAAKKKAQEDELKKDRLRNLNPNINCHFREVEAATISQILLPHDLVLGDKQVIAPFANIKYRANVRIVDYFPARLEDFAVGWRSSEFDTLEDFSGQEDTDIEMSRKTWQSGQGHQKDKWEWRFALQVEDAENDGSSDKMWLIVDNTSAQMLLNLDENATSLRNDPALLAQLKEQLFKLWGDLEERKSATLPKEPTRKPPKYLSSTAELDIPSSPPPRPGEDMPSMDSDDESSKQSQIGSTAKLERSALAEHNTNFDVAVAELGIGKNHIAVKNKGFTCCIRQYGVKVHEEDESKADAGEERRWQRMYGLFGTMIR